MGRKVLITGGAGFIGSHLANRMIAEGYEVCLLDNLTLQVHPHGLPLYLNSQAEMRRADVRDKAALTEAMKDVNIIVHSTMLAIEKSAANYQVFNIGAGLPRAISEIALIR